MAFFFGPSVRDEICLLVRARSANSLLQVWDSADFTGTKLAQFTMGSPAFGTPTDGTIIATPIPPTTALATGQALAWRILAAADSSLVLRGNIGGPSSGADWEIETVNAQILQNQTFAILSFSYTAPL